ncbi:MAG: nucleotidyl transferase AbiEii/AbiGii toxin family protein [Deltaproteobacteria bacterium]
MIKKAYTPISLFHEQVDEFRAALEYTQSATTFPAELLEKDYLSTLILDNIFQQTNHSLVFRGGTCLNKVHLGFYRMSEDLDFTISTPEGTSRSTRSKMVSPLKEALSTLPQVLPIFSISKQLEGSNNSTQYRAEVFYQSCITGQPSNITIEVGLRESLLRKPLQGEAKTILINPFTGRAVVSPIRVVCFDILEAFSEKLRAAVCRKIPAIRDLYDIFYAIQKNLITLTDSTFKNLVRKKIMVPGNCLIPLTEERIKEFRRQIDTDLRPVLGEENFKNFDFEKVVIQIKSIIDDLKF